MIKVNLPIWLNKGEVIKFKNALVKFWEKLEECLLFPIKQSDPETCDERLLFLFAYQRDIKRLSNEPLSLFRKRIKYAFINAQDSASVIGFKNIFMRLGIGTVEILERQKGYDWDVIILRVSDSQLSQNQTLINEIVRQYGRTCRRYNFEIIVVGRAFYNCGEFGNVTSYNGVKYNG
ncbi:hypothetical protein RHO14_07030 [Orbus wheelerorum]|uniref:hypothetical protein n=1 Tax=Orbus wheelerorum TaxID=3074111 RepID=UPI00370DABC4